MEKKLKKPIFTNVFRFLNFFKIEEICRFTFPYSPPILKKTL